ncbi:MAG: lipoprotein [Burkholderiales bacterium]|nr:lipoprotein [Burkholderiales bacterium]
MLGPSGRSGAVLALALVLLLVGCGTKGDLYLPESRDRPPDNSARR